MVPGGFEAQIAGVRLAKVLAAAMPVQVTAGSYVDDEIVGVPETLGRPHRGSLQVGGSSSDHFQ